MKLLYFILLVGLCSIGLEGQAYELKLKDLEPQWEYYLSSTKNADSMMVAEENYNVIDDGFMYYLANVDSVYTEDNGTRITNSRGFQLAKINMETGEILWRQQMLAPQDIGRFEFYSNIYFEKDEGKVCLFGAENIDSEALRAWQIFNGATYKMKERCFDIEAGALLETVVGQDTIATTSIDPQFLGFLSGRSHREGSR